MGEPAESLCMISRERTEHYPSGKCESKATHVVFGMGDGVARLLVCTFHSHNYRTGKGYTVREIPERLEVE